MIYKGVYMKIKTGVDIIEVPRIQEAIERHGLLFLKRVYSTEEINYCNNTGKMKYQHYAARFAAKEAVFKAISDLIDYSKEDIWRNIVIKNEKGGKPFVKFSGALEFLNIDKEKESEDKEKINDKKVKIESMDLSVSHIKDYAIANFVLLINE